MIWSKFNEWYPGELLNLTRFTLAAFAITFVSVTSVLLPAQSVRAESANVIEEVVVTARKREESLQETPLAVSVLTSAVIESQRVEGIRDLGIIVPGLITTETTSAPLAWSFCAALDRAASPRLSIRPYPSILTVSASAVPH